MTISYKWISEYIPVVVEPEKISGILTSIGLEVESMEEYVSVKGGLKGLVVGEVIESNQHPAADKLKVTKVSVGTGEPLKIVCGAPNVAVGQKVIVAPAGTTIYPLKGEPITMKTAKIRGEESFGMICAEDEIGIGESHDGIVVLPAGLQAGSAVADYYKVYSDWIYEIGLTPNRMDAMSHLGVAKDVCAYLSQHEGKDIRVKPNAVLNVQGTKESPIDVIIENEAACKRYTGIYIEGIHVTESPAWLRERLKAIGQRPINNIVDITNYILHDSGQPLHAFDAEKIAGNKIIVKNLPDGTLFKTLDEKERKLSSEDLMICDGDGNGMCIAGVFGGIDSGVTVATKNIFLESAWFNPVEIRKTSFRHGLRTDAATRFEKSVDISQTLAVLHRAATMITEIAGGKTETVSVDVYPLPAPRNEVELKYAFVEKLSGKKYDAGSIKRILTALGFEIKSETSETLTISVPHSKPDITLQADVVEEIMRIDGYDNIVIPARIKITPSVGAMDESLKRKEKTADFLVGAGFSEIFTNSITNSAYFQGDDEGQMVKLLNNLSAVHNVMRPSMLETGLESIAYNLNRKNSTLRFFEFGRTYATSSAGRYFEEEHLCLYATGSSTLNWKGKDRPADFFYLKGVVEAVMKMCGWNEMEWQSIEEKKLKYGTVLNRAGKKMVEVGVVSKNELQRFDIKQDVYFADLRWSKILDYAMKDEIKFSELSNQLPVTRDLAMVIDAGMNYGEVEKAIRKIKLARLRGIQLFDVFESEKLGAGKKSMAISLTFLDDEKTLTDKEIDGMMMKIMRTLEQDLTAEIRKGAENTTA